MGIIRASAMAVEQYSKNLARSRGTSGICARRTQRNVAEMRRPRIPRSLQACSNSFHGVMPVFSHQVTDARRCPCREHLSFMHTFLSCTQWVRAKLNDPGVTNWVHVAGRHRCSKGSDIVRRLAGGCRPTPRRQFGFHSRVVRCASAICSRAKPAQRRRARENSGPNFRE